jgi:thiosulfate reductase cytochrome b subunit
MWPIAMRPPLRPKRWQAQKLRFSLSTMANVGRTSAARPFGLLLMSGLQIFHAHPVLRWGGSSYNRAPVFYALTYGFPSWMMLPDERWVAIGRPWHPFFAWMFAINGLIYVSYPVVSRYLARDLFSRAPTCSL